MFVLHSQTCNADSLLLCLVSPRIPAGVCKWKRNRLQRNEQRYKNRKDVPEMGIQSTTQTKVCMQAAGLCFYKIFCNLFSTFLSAASRHRATPWQTWSQTSAETLMETVGDPGVTPQTPTPAGSTVHYPAALVKPVSVGFLLDLSDISFII